jgi:hypothetical protein
LLLGLNIMPTLKQGLLSGVACLALFETSSAIAASPLMSWSGFYIGGQVGYSWGSLHDAQRRYPTSISAELLGK